MTNIKKMITKYMQKVTLLMVGVILLVAFVVQMLNEQYQARKSAYATIDQIEQILSENQKELDEIEKEYRQTCLSSAEAIAYIIQYHPEVLEAVDELKKIAEFMEVDEIHIFDKNGQIFMGTHPEYFGYNFDSGEQIGYFKPMLKDKNLKLCQEITPNTAEEKLMQYSALWSEDGEFIVQVGMEPVHVMQITEKNELSYIFSLLRANVGVDFYAINALSGEIVGSTDSTEVGKKLTELGFDLYDVRKRGEGFHANINGANSYCIFKRVNGNYIGQVVSNDVLYERIPSNVVGMWLGLMCIAMILVYAVTWYMNKYVIGGIQDVNEKLRAITDGKLDEHVEVRNSLEFSELSAHINDMIKSLLSGTEKMSYVLNKTNMHIGVYEYNEKMKNVRFTEHTPKILALDEYKKRELSSDYKLFEAYIDKLRENPVTKEEGVFCLNGGNKRYVKLEEVTQNNDVFGIVIDVTEEVLKRKQLEAERDIDLLTGLYNRRGMENRLSQLFSEPEQNGYGALIMIDADGLKGINDKYGHEMGDMYLQKISLVLNSFGMKSSMTARQGGDEFVLYLYQYESEEEVLNAIKTLEYIQHNSSAHLREDLTVPLRFSFGFSLTNGQDDYQSLLKEADDKMYKNKRERKKNVT